MVHRVEDHWKRNTFARPLSKARTWKLTARCRAQATHTTCTRKKGQERGREKTEKETRGAGRQEIPAI